jgi:hypothetical protein
VTLYNVKQDNAKWLWMTAGRNVIVAYFKALSWHSPGENSQFPAIKQPPSNTLFLCSVGYEVLTVVVMKSTIFCDMIPCSPLKANHRFGDISPPFQGRRISLLSCWFLAQLILRACRWRWYVLPKRWLTFNELHSIISQKTVLFTLPSCSSAWSNKAYLLPIKWVMMIQASEISLYRD